VSVADRVKVTPVSDCLSRVELRFGFMEKPNVPEGLGVAIEHGHIPPSDLKSLTYFTGHETIIPSGRRAGMAPWREAIFALMHHNAQRPGAYFNIPNAQVLEIGVEFVI
jgi:KUP system potassium uptake protein